MSDRRKTSNIERLAKATAFLDKVLKTSEDDVQRAAAIQAFEMCFELSWRVMKDWLEMQGISLASPREIIRESARQGLIDNPAEWLDFLETRNLSAHTYNEQNAVEAYRIIKDLFAASVNMLLSGVRAAE